MRRDNRGNDNLTGVVAAASRARIERSLNAARPDLRRDHRQLAASVIAAAMHITFCALILTDWGINPSPL